jgi:hypothetical protein
LINSTKGNMMKNEELLHRPGSRLNDFTRAIRDLCLAQGDALVTMRNGDRCKVCYVPKDGEHPYDDCFEGGFRSPDGCRYWKANGKSIAGDDYDIIEFDAPVLSVEAAAEDVPAPLLVRLHSAVLSLRCDPSESKAAQFGFNAGVHSAAALISKFSVIPRNGHGLDTAYFMRCFARVLPALDQYTPAEFARELGRMAATADRSALVADILTEQVRTSVQDNVVQALGDAYDCTRKWSAWSIGTMNQDDFHLVVQDESRVADIVSAALDALV